MASINEVPSENNLLWCWGLWGYWWCFLYSPHTSWFPENGLLVFVLLVYPAVVSASNYLHYHPLKHSLKYPEASFSLAEVWPGNKNSACGFGTTFMAEPSLGTLSARHPISAPLSFGCALWSSKARRHTAFSLRLKTSPLNCALWKKEACGKITKKTAK